MTANKEEGNIGGFSAQDRPKFATGFPFLGDFSKRDPAVIETVKRYFRGPLTGPVVVPTSQEPALPTEETDESVE